MFGKTVSPILTLRLSVVKKLAEECRSQWNRERVVSGEGKACQRVQARAGGETIAWRSA